LRLDKHLFLPGGAFGVAEHFGLAQDSRMDFQAYFDLQLGSGSFWLGYCAALLAEDSG